MGIKASRTRLGILGGGQLARMIAEAALREGLRPVVLAESRDEPAAIEGALWVPGALHDRKAVATLASQADVLTIENEFVDVDLLRDVLEEYPGVRLAPGLKSISIAQDKLAQKRLFNKLGLASPDCERVEIERMHQAMPVLRQRFPDGFVLKFARFGYDGRGNLLVKPTAPTLDSDIDFFCRAAARAGSAVFAERLVDFTAELAVVATRTADGRLQCFPVVESRQEHGICREVAGPAAHLDTPPWIAAQAAEAISRIADHLQFCGTLAVEFFLTKAGELLINEMAPRVHNSGHYSLYGRESSQFDLHIQAIEGQALTIPEVNGFAAMRNILGPEGMVPGLPCPAPSQRVPKGVELHWYGKRTVSTGRKMGHLTGRANTAAELQQMLDAMRRYEERYWSEFAAIQQAG